MSKILIMTDSACDISEAEEKELSIDILPFPIMLGGKSYISRVDFDNDLNDPSIQRRDDMMRFQKPLRSLRINLFRFILREQKKDMSISFLSRSTLRVP